MSVQAQWQTNGTSAYYNNGNVGIGTSTPAYKLEVNTTAYGEQSSVGIQQVNSSGNPVNQPTSRLIYHWYNTPKAAINFHRGTSSADGFLSFSTSGDGTLQERMRIGTFGNIGVGTTSPQGLFDVNGSAYANTFSARQYLSAWVLDALPGDKFSYDNKDMPNYGITWVNDSWVGGAATQWISGNAGIKFFTQTQPRMVIHYNGNVGIGTTSPAAFLDIGNPVPGTLSAVLGRLPEGNSIGSGTYLGVRNLGTNPVNTISFALEHKFYGVANSAINFHRGASMNGGFLSFATNDGTEKMRLDEGGNLCIGTTTAQSKLTVNGDVTAKKVRVTQQGWADYVFDSSYEIQSLQQVKNYIQNYKHLPGIPTAQQIEQSGLDMGEMLKLQQVKIEELTIHLINQENKNEELQSVIRKQDEKIELLENKLNALIKTLQK